MATRDILNLNNSIAPRLIRCLYITHHTHARLARREELLMKPLEVSHLNGFDGLDTHTLPIGVGTKNLLAKEPGGHRRGLRLTFLNEGNGLGTLT